MTKAQTTQGPVPTYSGVKPLKEILSACRKNRWPYNTDKHDLEGSDWVTIGFVHGRRAFDVVFSTFNGKFIVRDGKDLVTEESTDYDDVSWYRALMDFLYVRKAEGGAA